MNRASVVGDVSRREGLGLVTGGAACVAAALFLRTWEVPYLAGTLVATMAAIALGWRGIPRLTWAVLLGSCAAMAITCVFAWRALGNAVPVESTIGPSTLASLREGSAEVMAELQRSAERLIALPDVGPGTPVTAIEPALPSASLGEAAGVVLHNGNAQAWAGLVRLPLADMALPMGIAHNEFYGVAYARASRNGREAIAMRTLYARPPADRLSRPWLAVMAGRLALDRVDVSTVPIDSAAGLDVDGTAVLWMKPIAPPAPLRRLELEERTRVVVLSLISVVLLSGMALTWRGPSGIGGRLATLAFIAATIGAAPLSTLSNVTSAFNSAYYFSPSGGPWTASVGALAMSGALACLSVFAFVRDRRWRPTPWLGLPLTAACVGGGPYLLRYLARGVELPPRGVPATLWVAWEVALFLTAAGLLLLGVWAAGSLRQRGLRHGAAWGSVIGAAAAMLAPVFLEAPGRFPQWYALPWIAAMATLVLTRRTRTIVIHVAFVAACGATTLVWGSITRKRVDLAERDVAGLGLSDTETRGLLFRLLDDVRTGPPPRTTSDLLRLYVGTELAAAGNPVELAVWTPRDTPEPDAELVIADLARRPEGERELARQADSTGAPEIRGFGSPQGMQLVLAAPLDSGHALTVVVAPRSRLIAEDPFAALLGLEVPTVVEPPYRLSVGPGGGTRTVAGARWVRRDDELHGDWQLEPALGSLHAHVEVELRPLDALLVRGTLLVIIDLAIFGVLWLLLALSDRALMRWLRGRAGRYRRSYRARLTVAIFGAFALPSIAFAIWTYNRLRSEDALSRSLLVQETLRAVRQRADLDLSSESGRLDAPLFLYRHGELAQTSDILYTRLAPLGHFLDPVAAEQVLWGSEESANRRLDVGRVPTLLGYRVLADLSVLAAPARRSELTLERQQRDLLALLAVSMVVGTLIALWLSGLAARAFAQPVAALRRAAGDVVAGARELPSLGREPPSEFTHVYGTFRNMAVDLSDSRIALESARRRTEAVLRDVASGVIALDRHGHVVLANPQAERLLGSLAGDGLARTPALDARARTFLATDHEDDAFELQLRGRELRARLTRLSRGDGGAVLTIDDVTDIARAQRVFAWGEMARQVAHEIKNPLTPIRLGVQHVRRAHADRRADFGAILDKNVDRILEEIDRLDEIARSFARFGLRPDEAQSAQPVDVVAVVRDVVDLERMGDSGVAWGVDLPEASLLALSREGELREVLLNLLENARLAHATQVTVGATRGDDGVRLTVHDNGDGIPADVMARLFEPQFSTRTSGSGLGLAISKRLVESWGGRIRLERGDPRGAIATVTLVAAPAT